MSGLASTPSEKDKGQQPLEEMDTPAIEAELQDRGFGLPPQWSSYRIDQQRELLAKLRNRQVVGELFEQKTLSVNPYLVSLLAGKGVQLLPLSEFSEIPTQDGQTIRVGQVTSQGTVVGFMLAGRMVEKEDGPLEFTVVMYDSSKEGQDDAVAYSTCVAKQDRNAFEEPESTD